MVKIQQKWFAVTSVVVVVIAVLVNSFWLLITSLLDEEQKYSILPFVLAVIVTVVIANGVIAIMQGFDVSPFDFLPERSLKESLRHQDPLRFMMTTSQDVHLLASQSQTAKNQKQYDWVLVFAEAWVRQSPRDAKAYVLLGEALNKLGRHHEAIAVGKKLSDIEPSKFEGFLIIGDGYSGLGDWEQAGNWYEKSFQRVTSPFKPFVLVDLVRTYEKLGLIRDAIHTLEELIPLVDSVSRSYYEDQLEYFLYLNA